MIHIYLFVSQLFECINTMFPHCHRCHVMHISFCHGFILCVYVCTCSHLHTCAGSPQDQLYCEVNKLKVCEGFRYWDLIRKRKKMSHRRADEKLYSIKNRKGMRQQETWKNDNEYRSIWKLEWNHWMPSARDIISETMHDKKR